MKKIIFVCLMFSIFAFAGCDLKERYKKNVELPLKIAGGQKLIVSTEVGSIKVYNSNQSQYSIKAEITGKGDTVENSKKVAESVKIAIENKDKDTISVKIDKPMEIKNEMVTVDYTIYVPFDINLECKTNVGSVDVADIKGDIKASCDVGSINCQNAVGRLELKTDVGDIHASYAKDAANITNADLRTNVGSIHFIAPPDLSAKVSASSNVGQISSNLPVVVTGDFCSKKLNASIGKAEGDIRLKTDVGSINIK